MAKLSHEDVRHFREQGYAVARGVFGKEEAGDLRGWYDQIADLAKRDLPDAYRNAPGPEVHIHVQAPDDVSGGEAVRYLRKVQWPAMFHSGFERVRNDVRWPALLEPLLGTSLKQFINQINYKMPGGDIEFPWHQDVRPTPAFENQVHNYVQTIIAVDDATPENGCLHIVPGSHRKGDLKAQRYAEGQIESVVNVDEAVPIEAEAGDVILFTSYTVHGSSPNRSQHPRRSYINGFVRAESCTVGKWAFLDGKPVPITSNYDYADIRIDPSPAA